LGPALKGESVVGLPETDGRLDVRRPDIEQVATELGALADRAVKLAEMLEAAETEAAAIAGECVRLGVADRLEGALTALQQVPSEAAEVLQDDLDRMVGELHHPPVSVGESAAHSPQLTVNAPTREQLSIVCSACGRHVRAAPVDGATADLRLDRRSYRCPHCGHRDRYETWDHFVEDQIDTS
jgi:DNA-directed RNA polymerase subunit RPC12/RpoP